MRSPGLQLLSQLKKQTNKPNPCMEHVRGLTNLFWSEEFFLNYLTSFSESMISKFLDIM